LDGYVVTAGTFKNKLVYYYTRTAICSYDNTCSCSRFVWQRGTCWCYDIFHDCLL